MSHHLQHHSKRFLLSGVATVLALLVLLLSLYPLIAHAVEPPFNPGDVASGGGVDGTALVLLLVGALRDGHWLLALSAAVIGAVWVARNILKPYWPRLGTGRAAAVMSLIAGQAAALANAAVTDTLGWPTLVRGLVAAFIASGGWSLPKAILPAPKASADARTGLGLAAVLLCVVVGTNGCAHSLAAPHTVRASPSNGLAAPEAAPFDFDAARAKSCAMYDSWYLACATATPVLGALASASAGLPALVSQLDEKAKATLLVTATIAGALGAGAGVCAQSFAARYTDRCSLSFLEPVAKAPSVSLRLPAFAPNVVATDAPEVLRVRGRSIAEPESTSVSGAPAQ